MAITQSTPPELGQRPRPEQTKRQFFFQERLERRSDLQMPFQDPVKQPVLVSQFSEIEQFEETVDRHLLRKFPILGAYYFPVRASQRVQPLRQKLHFRSIGR